MQSGAFKFFFHFVFLGKLIVIIGLNINIVLNKNKRVQQNVTRYYSIENNNGFYMCFFLTL